MEYKIETKNFPEIFVACFRFQGAYSEIGKYLGILFEEINGNVAGAPFCLFYDEGYAQIADIEICVPIKKLTSAQKLTTRILPAFKVISTMHVGSYETVDNAYAALADYAKTNGLETYAPSREIYIKGPGMIFKGNPDKYVTEVALSVR
ncbi:MAG: GyrI-like domain-containing protein [Saccharofermentanales bacterium]